MHGAHGTRGGAASARVELCKDSGDKCHAQFAARRSHPPLGLSRTEPGVCWWLPRCFFPFLRALPERLRSQEAARAPFPGAAPPSPPPKALPRHLRHSHHQFTAGPPLPQGCSRGRGRHSWAGSDSSAQLEGAQLRTGMEGGAVWTLREGGEAAGRAVGATSAGTHTGRRCCHKRKSLICWE